jgi:hypothetical protein
MSISAAAGALDPPMPRRELARRLRDVASCGTQYGPRGRRAALYPVDTIMRAHAAWVRDGGGRSQRVPQFGHLHPAQTTVSDTEGVRHGG